MTVRTFAVSLALVLVFTGSRSGLLYAVPAITLLDIGTLGGSSSVALAVNDYGQVVGSSSTVGDAEQHAFSWTAAGGMVDLGTFGGRTAATGVNNNGLVVGYSDDSSTRRALVWTAADGMVDIGSLGGGSSAAFGVNDSGQVVGWSEVITGQAPHAFVWTLAEGMTDLGTLGDPSWQSVATAINESGQIVGWSRSSKLGDVHAFSWTAGGGMVDLGTLGGTRSSAEAVSDSGQVVGSSHLAGDAEMRAFSWTTTGMVNLGVLTSGSTLSAAAGVNSSGQVVGYSYLHPAPEPHAVSWTSGGALIDLGTLGGTTSAAAAINESGLIAGYSTLADGTQHAVVWSIGVATPEDIVAALANDAIIVGFAQSTNLLERVVDLLAQDRTATACNQLHAFINQVEAHSAQSLTVDEADRLIQMARDALEGLGCGS
jgi:probable HAF family extracellular repeat protein